MKLTILNGESEYFDGSFTRQIESLTCKMNEEHSVSHFRLKDMDIKFCSGCWNCWWKHPGKCSIKDDGEEIFRSVINSDFFIFASPLKAGFTSSRLKAITDRLIVLLHPYVEIRAGESHHKKRYDSYPDFGLLLKKEIGTADADTKIISDIYERLALNFHCRKRYLKYIDETSFEEVINESCSF